MSEETRRKLAAATSNVGARFATKASRQFSESPTVKTYKIPISAMDASTGRLTFPHPLTDENGDEVTVEAGDACRIREPKYELNRWKGRTCRITPPPGAGDPFDVLITHNDRNTLFFAPRDEVVPVGSTYEIIELQYGAVYKWDGSKFIAPTGADSVRMGVPVPADFHQDLFENSPSIERDYGLYMKGDINHMQVIETLYKILNKLFKTKTSVAWTSNGETNSRRFDDSGSSEGITCEIGQAIGTDNYNGPAKVDESLNGVPPTVYTNLNIAAPDSFSGAYEVDVVRRYAYGLVTSIPTFLQHSVEIWGVGRLPGGGEEFDTITDTSPGEVQQEDKGVFNSQGDSATYNTWAMLGSDGPTIADEFMVLVGNDDLSATPSWGACPDVTVPSGYDAKQSSLIYGYEIGTRAAVLDWSVDPTVFLDPV